jgi:hypothetical protein
VKACPDLPRHSCVGPDGRHFLEGSQNPCDDLAHLFEHVVIDLGARISSLDRVSGVTCGLRYPPNRYHVFVECDGPRAGEFIARLAAWAIERTSDGRAALPSLYGAARAFAHAEGRPELLDDGRALARAARVDAGQAAAVADLVRRFRPAGRSARHAADA